MSPLIISLCVLLWLSVMTVIIIFVPFQWHMDRHYPSYSLYKKIKDDRVKHRPQIDIEQCENNLEMLDTIMKKHNLFYFLSDGSALGAKRDQRLLPWDDDVDIGIFQPEKDRFMNDVLPDLLNEEFEYNHSRTNFIALHRKGEKVDVCIYGKGWSDTGHLKDGSILLPLVREFETVQIGKNSYNVPKQEDYYEFLYGKNWRIPDDSYKQPFDNR